MADRLTQLQDCLDQFLVQMYATIRYLDTHHSAAHIDGQIDQFAPVPDMPSIDAVGAQQSQTVPSGGDQQQQPPPEPISSAHPHPDPAQLFTQRMTELAQDLVLKEQQIEALIAALPGIGSSQAAQEKRLRELDEELRRVEAERDKWKGEREKLGKTLDTWIVNGVRRV